ncbi:MAG TPA: Gfo/Idh/MocA family oxidoreductase [Chthoniobacterales bacterium]|jgi:predicted dehydrogenase
MPGTTVKLGVLGLHNHYHIYPMAEYLRRGIPGVELVAVYHDHQEQAEQFAKSYGGLTVYGSRQELLSQSDLDAVLIMSFTASHHDDVLACVERKKHILVDKPIALNVREATEMVRVAEEGNVVFMMAYLIRYLPAYKKAKELIQSGVIGRPLTMKISIRCPLGFIRDNPTATEPGWYTDPERGGAGGFLDHGIHYADAMRFLLGSEPVKVFGKVSKVTDHQIAVDDYGVCVVTTDKGEIVTIESSWHAPQWYAPLTSQEECLIVGTEGELHIHYQKSPQLEVSGNGVAGREYYDWLNEDRYEICYRDALIDFVAVIREGRKASVTGYDGQLALSVIEGAYLSSQIGREVNLKSAD